MRGISVAGMSFEPVDLWMNQWLLLTSGTLEDCNMMTVAWGSVGCMWGKPFAQIVVRPQRHTHKYLEANDSFTLCGFPEEFREDLQTLGTLSGRDGDKLAKTKLTIMQSSKVSAPSYGQASLILECRKIYRQKFDPEGFVDASIANQYPSRDYHTVYFGEILAAFSN